MYIRTNKDKTIHLVSDKKQGDTVEFCEELPDDFYQTFSKGKYLLAGSTLSVNPAWNEANQEVVTFPDAIPHRSLLLAAGISSIYELQQIDDLTTIAGIGSAKAAEIHEYLTTINKE